MKQLEKSLKAVANQRRLAIMKLLKETSEASVGEIAREIKMPFRTTSKHLGILLAANIVDKEQRGFSVYYFLSKDQKPVVKDVISFL